MGPADAPSPALPLTPDQRDAIGRARIAARKVFRAAGVASISGWTVAVFGFVTLLSGIFSAAAGLLGVGMLACAYVELKNARALRRFDAGACRRLGCNQLALGAMIVLYGAWGLYRSFTGPTPYDDYLRTSDEMAGALEPFAQLHVLVSVLLYSTVIVGGAVSTGGAALYYFTRRAHVDRCLARLPGWIIDTLRAAA